MVSEQISIRINGKVITASVEPRLLLSDFIRRQGLTGTHVGCEHGVCGSCTILLRSPLPGGRHTSGEWDGWEAVRSCLLFAAQMDECEMMTIEGLAPPKGDLHPLQQAFHKHHALQCGFCTPGFLLSLLPFLRDVPNPTEIEIREALSGNLCRCTGYTQIVEAVYEAARMNANPKDIGGNSQ
jgi:carbon-monoxide dehydrogenase small subunit